MSHTYTAKTTNDFKLLSRVVAIEINGRTVSNKC